MDHRANAALEPEPIAGVDLDGLATLDPIARDLSLADAASDTGLLVAGTQSYGPSGRVLRAEAVFNKVRPALSQNLCAETLRGVLDDATSRLLYTSATDAPIRTIAPGAIRELPSIANIVTAVGMTAPAVVRVDAFDGFIRPLTATESDAPSEQLRAARFRGLERTLRAQLTNLTVYRVGTVDVRILVVGVTACGEVAGVETTALER